MDALRGERILAFLLEEGWLRRRDVHTAAPAAEEELRRVHRPAYLRSLEDPEKVGRILGFPVGPEEARAAVELQRLAAGGTIRAAALALRGRGVAVHLGGGLHHAAPDEGMGFCLLNDVAVAVARLRATGFDEPVAVVDLDLHDGNGTRAAFADDATVHTFSIHNRSWDDRPAVASTSVEVGPGIGDAAYLEALRRTLPPVLARHRPGLVFYLAGVDPAADDTYGDGRLTPGGLLERDRFVFESVHRGRRGVPLVVTLAGGYGGAAWRHSARFFSWILSGRSPELPDDVEVSLRRVRWLEEERWPFPERGGSAPAQPPPGGGSRGWLDWSLDENDLEGVAPRVERETLLLGRYGPTEVEVALERFGILQQIRTRGHRSPEVEVTPSSGFGPTLRVWGEAERRTLLVELRLRVDPAFLPGMRVLLVEWLLLQDPGGRFPAGFPPLPGQEHPGLGVMSDLMAWLATVCRETGLDGLGFRSSHFHIAVLGRRHLRFLSPEDAGHFHRIADRVRGLPLGEAARRVAEGRVSDPETGDPLRWIDVPMVVPVSERMRRTLGPAEGADGPDLRFHDRGH
jgi:acetoin utilization deacetylase AcuC-like enzyme